MIKENYIFFDIDAKNKEEALDFISKIGRASCRERV